MQLSWYPSLLSLVITIIVIIMIIMLINYHDHDNIDGPKGVKISQKGKKQTSILNRHMKLSKQKGIFLLCPLSSHEETSGLSPDEKTRLLISMLGKAML